MKILFIARHYSYLRLFESAIDALAARGHEIVLAADREEALGGRQMVERIAAAHPAVRLTEAPGRHAGAWSEVARRVRMGLDYLRFLDPRYADTPHLRRRSRDRAPVAVVRLAESAAGGWFGGPAGLGRILRWFERGVPDARQSEAFIRGERPDVVLITPLVDIGSPQLDHFAAARRLGVRTVLPVGSWDHLSSKALLRVYPDLLTVWNEVQRREAIELHGVPADRVVVTGAQCYDQWFDRAPAAGYEAFCAKVGLRPDRPFVLYACSSLFKGTANEPEFAEQWIQALRASTDPRLADIGILVRPHPARLDEWRAVDLTGYRNVAFWGAHPVDAEAKDDYFDSLYYSAAVVGINTSAFIEAAVVGKPVLTVMLPEISAANQEGTLHFHYLLTVNGGLLRTSRSLEEHVPQLAAALAGHGGGDAKAEAFVEGFVRPYGRPEAATPRFVSAIESIAARPAPAPEPRTLGARLAYAMLFPLAAWISLNLRTQPWRKRTRSRLRKAYERRKLAVLRGVKQLVTNQFIAAGKQRKVSTPSAPSSLTPKAGRQRDPAKTLAGTEFREARETRELVTVLGRSGRPIVIGPWLSETGFELLYWIPFLAWAKAYGNFDPERLVVVSRGGAAGWYSDITHHYEDVFSYYTPDEFRIRNEQRIAEQKGRQKHIEITSFDREILDRVIAARGLHGAEVLHPSQMYQLFDNFWLQRTPVTLVEAFARFGPIPQAPPLGVRAQLPERYVAAKFYGNVALPPTPGNRDFVAQYLSTLAQNVDVVLLNTGHQFDDHQDFSAALRGRLHTIDHLMTPQNNLAVQTEVIRHAEAFVGTYGGFSYLAPLCGVNTVAFYSHASGFRWDHLEVAKRVFSALRCGTFTEVDLRAADAIRLGFGAPGTTADLDKMGDGAVNVLTAARNLAAKYQRKASRRARWTSAVAEEGVKDSMHAVRRAGEGVRDRFINTVKGAYKAVRKPLRTASRHRHQRREQQEFNRIEWQVEDEIDRLLAGSAAGGRPLVVGPWISEVGFEALYWLPFLRWVKTAFRLDPARVVAVSRGGVGSWYAGIADRYVEIWDLMEPADFARQNAARGVTKHYEPSALDEAILAGVARQLGTREFDVLHPGLMYRLFNLYWSGQRAMGFVDAHTRFERVVPQRILDPSLLPADYIAVKFYAARSLPDTPAIRDWMRRTVASLAEQAPVVLLDTGLVLEDDHADFALATRGRVISAREWMTPRDNLGIQTQIVAGARAFVGTCGSIAWLAPQLGVDTSALFVDPKWLHAHLPVAMRAYHRMGAGRFSVADLRAVEPLGALADTPAAVSGAVDPP